MALCVCVCVLIYMQIAFTRKKLIIEKIARTPEATRRGRIGRCSPEQPFQPALILLPFSTHLCCNIPACSAHLIPIFGAGWSLAVGGEEDCRLTLCWAIENRSAKVERMRRSGKQKEMGEGGGSERELHTYFKWIEIKISYIKMCERMKWIACVCVCERVFVCVCLCACVLCVHKSTVDATHF